MSEENVALVRKLFDALDAKDKAAVSELVTDDFIAHVAGQPPDVERAGWDERVEMLYTGFPDLVHDYDQWFSEGDSVMLRRRCGVPTRGCSWALNPRGNQYGSRPWEYSR